MEVCEEMKKLREALDDMKIPWEDHSEEYDSDFPIWFCRTWFHCEGKLYSVINGFATYGGWFGINPGIEEKDNLGLLELMSPESDGPIGFLTAEEIIKKIKEKMK